MKEFPERFEAVVLAGGKFEEVESGELKPPCKGLLSIGGIPMAARVVRALASSSQVSRIILVSSVKKEELSAKVWSGVDEVVEAGESLMDSFRVGVEAAENRELPVLVVAGDLPFLSRVAVEDFLARCRERSEASVWYGYLRRENSVASFPGVKRTWGHMKEGDFCGAGLFLGRPEAFTAIYKAMEQLTFARKRPWLLAKLLGWRHLANLLCRRFSITEAEEAMTRLFGGVVSVGIETPYAETAFNVDDLDSLREARRRLPCYLSCDEAPAAIGPYSQAVRAGGMLFTSGQIGMSAGGSELVCDQVEEQTHQVMKNLEAILTRESLGWEHVVKVQIFLADMQDFSKVNEIYTSYLGRYKPARACVEVSELPKGAKVEIDCVAVIGHL